MRSIFTLLALLVLIPTRAPVLAQTLEHSTGGTVADSLMKAWVQMWETDDVDAVAELYADDVVIHTDTFATGLQGKHDVLEVTARRMAQVGPLVIEPDHSFQQGDIAYQTGRFLINGETGAYSFVFVRQKEGTWKLRYTYYLHDKLAGARPYRRTTPPNNAL